MKTKPIPTSCKNILQYSVNNFNARDGVLGVKNTISGTWVCGIIVAYKAANNLQ